MLPPLYYKRKNYKITIRLTQGNGEYYWTDPVRLDYEALLWYVKMAAQQCIEYRYMYMGMVWCSL